MIGCDGPTGDVGQRGRLRGTNVGILPGTGHPAADGSAASGLRPGLPHVASGRLQSVGIASAPVRRSESQLDARGHPQLHGAQTGLQPRQSRLPALRQRPRRHESRRTQSLSAVHDGLFVAAARRTGQFVSQVDGRPQSRRHRQRQLSVSQYLCPLSQASRI